MTIEPTPAPIPAYVAPIYTPPTEDELAAREQERQALMAKRNAYYDSRSWMLQNRNGPGAKAYKWTGSFKGADGNYYEEHTSVTGRKTKLYSLAELKWTEDIVRQVGYCAGCNTQIPNALAGNRHMNTCPTCGKTDNTFYRSIY